MDIPKDGYRDFFQFQTEWKGKNHKKKVNAIAYRSGTGTSVALSMSTTNSNLHWDLIPAKNKDLRWYFDTIDEHDRLMKGFDTLEGASSRAVELSLLDAVLPRTCGEAGQGTKEWFLDRMFSATSSQMHHLVVAAAPTLSDTTDPSSELRKHLMNVLKYTNEEDAAATSPASSAPTNAAPSASSLADDASPTTTISPASASAPAPSPAPVLLNPTSSDPSSSAQAPSIPASIPTNAPPPTSPPAENTASLDVEPASASAAEEEEKESERQEEKSDDQIQAEDWIERLLMPNTNEGDDDFKEHLQNLTRSTLSWMHWILSASTGTFKESSKPSTVKKFQEWITKSREERPFFLMKKAKLVEIARSKGERANIQNGKEDLVKKILHGIKREKEQEVSGSGDTTNNGTANNNTTNDSTTTSDAELTPLAKIFHFSFLRPQKQMSERKAARIGHENERKFLLEFWGLIQDKRFNLPDSIEPMPVKVIYRPGLVCRKGECNTFVKDSADGVVVFSNSVSDRYFCVCVFLLAVT